MGTTSAIVEVRKLNKTKVITKLASYFKVKREELLNEVDLDGNTLLKFPTLEQQQFSLEIYATGVVNKISIMELMDGKKFEKSEIYDHFLNGEGMTSNKDFYMLTFFIGDMCFAVYRAAEYGGLGGIKVDIDNDNSFVIEPFNNLLLYLYPQQTPD
jgi:hypothetical protein